MKNPAWLLLAALLAGCATAPVQVEEHEHEHMHRGPNGGVVAAWGESYHVEFVVDHDRQQAVVHVLDGEAAGPAPIAVECLLLVLQRPEHEVALAPEPRDGEPEGRASRFIGAMPEPTRGRKFAGSIRGDVGGVVCEGDFDQQRHCCIVAEQGRR
jgi:hypothetical protein